jgi:hypothetical protein
LFCCLFLDQNLWRYPCPPTQKMWPSTLSLSTNAKDVTISDTVEAINLPLIVLPSTVSSCQTFLFVLQL